MQLGPRTKAGIGIGIVVVIVAAVLSILFHDFGWIEIGLLLAVGIGLILVIGKLEGLARVVSRPIHVDDSLKTANSPGEPLDMLRRDLQRDISALLALDRLLPEVGSVPAPGGWAATPETLLALVARVIELPAPVNIVECGSGTSTIWIALALKHRGNGRLISLEHDPEYAAVARTRLDELGLSDWVELRTAPIEPTAIDGVEYTWYASSAVGDIEEISLLFVDGPPGSIGDHARFPALQMLGDKVVSGGWIVLDDIDRPEEQHIRDRWIASSSAGRTLTLHGQTDRAAILEIGELPTR